MLEANKILAGDRDVDYGNPVESFEKISSIASVLTGKHLTKQDCVKVLLAVKLTRESYKHKEDNLIDIIGYSQILNNIEADENVR